MGYHESEQGHKERRLSYGTVPVLSLLIYIG